MRRRGPACSSRPTCGPAAGAGGRVTLRLPSRVGGAHPPCLGGGVAPRPPRSRSRRRPAVPLSGPLRVAGALPSGARVRSGLECRPGVGGGEGPPVDRSPGGPSRPANPPSVPSEWAVVTGGSCGARPPSCSVVRVAPARLRGFAGAGPAAVALTVSPSLLWVGAPPRPWGGGGPRLWLPSWGGCAEGGGGGRPPARSRVCVEGGGGEWGGPSVPWRCLLSAKKGGGGGLAVPAPGASHRPGGSRPSPAPLYREPDSLAVSLWGPSSPGRCRAALAGRGWP